MASFLSTLFGGGAEKDAADQNRAMYADYMKNGATLLNNGMNRSLASLGQGYGDANSTLNQNKDVYANYGTTANGALDSGLTNSLASLNDAKAAYDPLAALGTKYGGATALGLDALGVNGADGNARASAAFTTAPGYDAGITAGLDVLNRRRAGAGMVDSGNADIDALTYGQNQQNQQYNTWLTNLLGFTSPELSATSGAATGRAGVDTNIANAYSTDAANRVGVAGNVAQGTAGANTGIAANQSALGAGQAGLYTQNASDLTNLTGQVVSGDAAANNMQAAGASAGAKNALGAGLSLASLAAGGFGGLGGAGAAGPTSTFGFNPVANAFKFGG